MINIIQNSKGDTMPEKIDIKKTKDKDDKKSDRRSTEIAARKENPFPFFQNFDRFFDDMRRGFGSMIIPDPYTAVSERSDLFRTPLANIEETDKEYMVKAELPGIDKEDIAVTLDDGKLEITADTKEEHEEKSNGNVIRREYRSSSFYRCFTIPENVNQDQIEGNYDRGILSIRIPKAPKKEKDKKSIVIK